MKKILIPDNLKGKELYTFLVSNKKDLIAQKKAAIKHTDPIIHKSMFVGDIPETKKSGVKSAGETETEVTKSGEGILGVKVVANTAWFCDSSMDVLTETCYDRSVKEKGTRIPHIEDHMWKSTSHVGDVKAVYTQRMRASELGLPNSMKTVALIFETDILEDYNPKVYKFYKKGKINQHSIGLMYVSIGLCINDKDYLPEYELWKKYYDKIINKDVVDERGYFWIVPEIIILENSCVLFGCNELTPTLEMEEKDNVDDHDENPNQPEADDGGTSKKKIDWSTIKF